MSRDAAVADALTEMASTDFERWAQEVPQPGDILADDAASTLNMWAITIENC
jgi:hypothetical protein